MRFLLRCLFRLLYRVEVDGLEHLHGAGKRVLLIANHASWLDGILLYAWLPGQPAFAIDRNVVAKLRWNFVLRLVPYFEIGDQSGLALKSLVEYLKQERHVVIFPEGRITTTGNLMKVYEGSGMVADHSKANILPLHIDGTQRSHFSYLRGRVPIQWFPKIRLSLFPPRRLQLPESLYGRARRTRATRQVEDMMRMAHYQSTLEHELLFDAVQQAARRNGKDRVVFQDQEDNTLSYRGLLLKARILASAIDRQTVGERYVGLMLPNVPAVAVAFLSLQSLGRVVAMLNFSMGIRNLLHTCQLAALKTVLSSRRFVETAGLEELAEELEKNVRVIYLEDLAQTITPGQKLCGVLRSLLPTIDLAKKSAKDPHAPAVVLFTSGSEAKPKGVVLSHANLLSNYAQIMCSVDFSMQDKLFSCLPLFHSFGLNVGFLTPLLAGTQIFLYPTPLHYRRIPELVYQSNATMLFGTNTFFRAYARGAHPYDFHTLRYAVAGAEKLQDDTLRLWMEKFGLRIYQGYGVTETSPVISVNTPLAGRIGSTGRLVPAMQARLVPVEGITQGGRLLVRGPNVMLGYLTGTQGHGTGTPDYAMPDHEYGPDWYDTGDIADIDEDGFLTLLGRARRFAKVGGEMISLTAVEEVVMRLWPNHHHAAISIPDVRKGERIVLLSNCPAAADGLRALRERVQEEQLGMLHVPQKIYVVDNIPTLSTGKTDYQALQRQVIELEQGR